MSEQLIPITILVPVSALAESVKRSPDNKMGKASEEWNPDTFRKDYEVDFEFTKFAGYQIDECDEDAVHEELCRQFREGEL